MMAMAVQVCPSAPMLIPKAKSFAIKKHSECGQMYNVLPYSYHLQDVVNTAYRFSNLVVPVELDVVIASCWLHDVIEDCRVKYGDILSMFGYDVAEIVFAVTSEKGKTRREREGDKYYLEMLQVPNAGFVKLCDRLANTLRAKQDNPKKLEMYRREYPMVRHYLYTDTYKPMFDNLEELMK